ncbi:sugar kinase [Aquisalibacillus elongatus]|uniref:5-dehydro-2-deoxygluconokinase n=1 Tax=Aquisalibacillus elongatus TaxID=485577 RepID=A0A3N5BA73_9BACI|nr:sugar kinase [Aquisalibacillus elongatus]RPF54303.1 5-dehydro-2-deoxygluconokinase [Aquisalibacillus elongatus]
MSQIDVFTLGETMVLFQPDQHAPLDYVHTFPKKIGGAESNVAIGLSRLGHTVSWFSQLGEDPFGRYILKTIRGEGVNVSTCQFTNEAPTGLLFKEQLSAEDVNVYYYRHQSAASFMKPEQLQEDSIANAKVLHITGITPALSESAYATVMKAIEIAKKNNVSVSFDPNLRLKLWSEERAKEVLSEIVKMADIILPGMDEGEFLTGQTQPEAISEALDPHKEKTIIIKLGDEGAYYSSENEEGYVPGYSVKQVVDPVGAGDGFAAGIISGILRKEPIDQVVRRANAIGAMVVSMTGDIEGLPSDEAVKRFMSPDQENRDVKR